MVKNRSFKTVHVAYIGLWVLASLAAGCGKIESIRGTCIGLQCYRGVTNLPTNLTAVAGDRSVQLSWSEVSGATKYTVHYGNSISLNGTEANEGASGEIQTTRTSLTLTGLTNNSEYLFAVSAVNAKNESSEKSTTAMATPVAPPIPVRDAISKIQIKTCIKGTDEFVINNGKLKINHIAGNLPELSQSCTLRFSHLVNISIYEDGVNGWQNYYWNPQFTGNASEEYDLHLDTVTDQEQSIINPLTQLAAWWRDCIARNTYWPYSCIEWNPSVGTVTQSGLVYTFDNMPNIANNGEAGPYEVIFDYKYKTPQE